jgi:hypothetical protein
MPSETQNPEELVRIIESMKRDLRISKELFEEELSKAKEREDLFEEKLRISNEQTNRANERAERAMEQRDLFQQELIISNEQTNRANERADSAIELKDLLQEDRDVCQLFQHPPLTIVKFVATVERLSSPGADNVSEQTKHRASSCQSEKLSERSQGLDYTIPRNVSLSSFRSSDLPPALRYNLQPISLTETRLVKVLSERLSPILLSTVIRKWTDLLIKLRKLLTKFIKIIGKSESEVGTTQKVFLLLLKGIAIDLRLDPDLLTISDETIQAQAGETIFTGILDVVRRAPLPQQSVSLAKKPASSTKKPASSTKKPASSTKKPASSTMKPAPLAKGSAPRSLVLHHYELKRSQSMFSWDPKSTRSQLFGENVILAQVQQSQLIRGLCADLNLISLGWYIPFNEDYRQWSGVQYYEERIAGAESYILRLVMSLLDFTSSELLDPSLTTLHEIKPSVLEAKEAPENLDPRSNSLQRGQKPEPKGAPGNPDPQQGSKKPKPKGGGGSKNNHSTRGVIRIVDFNRDYEEEQAREERDALVKWSRQLLQNSPLPLTAQTLDENNNRCLLPGHSQMAKLLETKRTAFANITNLI